MTWNPKRWNWTDVNQNSTDVASGKTVQIRWSTGNRKDIPFGSRLFLLKQGDGRRGIIASGFAAAPVEHAPHYDPVRASNGDTALYTVMEFDSLLDLESSSPLSKNDCGETLLNGIDWNAQSSGFAIKEEIISELENRWATHLGQSEPQASFLVGGRYSRFDVLGKLGLPVRRGGNPFTGYFQNNDDIILFVTLGNEAGSTGHNYPNQWEGPLLRWYTKGGTSLGNPSVQALLSDESAVHLFTREKARDSFMYVGQVEAESYEDVSPVLIRWRVVDKDSALLHSYGEVDGSIVYQEGALKQVTVNSRERDPRARRACIEHHGLACCVCGMTFREMYGELGGDFIHVHHLEPIGSMEGGEEREVDPINDLRPVCPNCHAMMHKRKHPISPEELKQIISNSLVQ